MRLRNTILTGASSYIQMGSIMLTQLMAIPLALHFLDNERFGLWSFVSQSLGYVFLLDFGVSSSLGRLLAEPLHGGDEKESNGWFNMVLLILLAQAVLIVTIGVALTDPLLHWFKIPTHLMAEARQLWLMMLLLNGVMLPTRLLTGVLGVQNRGYWSFVASTVSMWCGLPAFLSLSLLVLLASGAAPPAEVPALAGLAAAALVLGALLATSLGTGLLGLFAAP